MSFSPLRQSDHSHLYHHPNPTSPSPTCIATFETKGYVLICTVIWNNMDFTMSESLNSADEDESLVQLFESCQLLERSAGCIPRDHRLKPKFEELMGDLEAEVLRMKKDSDELRQTPTGSASIDTPPTGPNDSSSPSPNIARPKPERRPTPDFFPKVKKGPPIINLTPEQHWEIQNAGRRKAKQPRGTHSRSSRIEKKRKRKPKTELTESQKKWRKALDRMK